MIEFFQFEDLSFLNLIKQRREIMNYRKMIIGILLIAVILVSFGMSDSDAYIIATPCATGDCEFGISSSLQRCNLATKAEQEIGDSDPGADYPYGLIEFTLGNNCGGSPPANINITPISSTVTLSFYKTSDHASLDLTGLVYRKYGRTPDNTEPHWYDFTYDGQTGAEINGNQVTLHFIDGDRGDDDLQLNGTIVDQGGPGRTGIPTMNEWGMIIFMALAGVGSVYYLRRKKIAG